MVSQEVDSSVTTSNPTALEGPTVTANHVAMTVNGHDSTPAVNGEHPSVSGDANGEMEVRPAVLIMSNCHSFDVLIVELMLCLLPEGIG